MVPRSSSTKPTAAVIPIDRRRLREHAERARALCEETLACPALYARVDIGRPELREELAGLDFDAALAGLALEGDSAEAATARRTIRTGRALFAFVDGRSTDAFAEWAEVIAEHPSYARARTTRAAAFCALEDHAAALADYNHAAVLCPTDAQVFFRRGDCHSALEDYERALADTRRGLTLDSSSSFSHASVGLYLRFDGSFAEATRAFDRALAVGPEHAQHHVERGRCYAARGELEAAMRDFDRAVEMLQDEAKEAAKETDPVPLATAFDERAKCHEQRGDLAHAVADYTSAAELDRRELQRWWTLADARERLGDDEGALEAFSFVGRYGAGYDPQFRADARWRGALCHRRQGRTTEAAEEALRAIFDSHHEITEALDRHLELFGAHAWNPRFRADVDLLLDTCLAHALLLGRARLHATEGRLIEAIADYGRLIQEGYWVPDEQHLRERARVWRKLADPKRARADMRRALKLERG